MKLCCKMISGSPVSTPSGKDLSTSMKIRLYSFALLMATLSAGIPLATGAPQEKAFSFEDAVALLEKHCEACHNGNAPEERPVSQFDVKRVQDPKSLVEEAALWKRVQTRLKEEEMPPVGRPAPTKEQRAALVKWIEESVKPAKAAVRVAPRFAGKASAVPVRVKPIAAVSNANSPR